MGFLLTTHNEREGKVYNIQILRWHKACFIYKQLYL